MEVGHIQNVGSWRRRDVLEVIPLWVRAETELQLHIGLVSWIEVRPGSSGIIEPGAPSPGEGQGGF